MTSGLSITEKLRLAFRLTFLAPWQILATVLRSFFIALARGIPPRLFLTCAVIKVVLRSFSPRQIQYLSLSTKDAYEAWIQRRTLKAHKKNDKPVMERLSYHVESLGESGASLLWLGDYRKAQKVVYFFHGGGYFAPLRPGHLEWCWQAYIETGIEMNVEVAVAVLEYTLCPHARYPVQLRQAAAGLAHLLSLGIQPQDLIIGGDSAGANLAAQLLCHFVQPQPTIWHTELSSPLGGCFLVSPLLTWQTNSASFLENGWIDMLSASSVDRSTTELLGCKCTKEIVHGSAGVAFPLDMEDSCLGELETVMSHLYVTAGQHEVFRDQAIAFVQEVRHSSPAIRVQFEIQENQAHDFILLEGQEERIGKCMQAMKKWFASLLVADCQAL
ncbi:Alpha/Beta hydrolase protein [Thelonectria olida]|uniref:Alpha/Beta hydrolase protein n=1 Tax=Thelonectria olida TaxID=1576542 RepID=A0A9P8W9G0_9HYPO|nr:Alpha/Beta hydrolase protein [Thelonectria olida]